MNQQKALRQGLPLGLEVTRLDESSARVSEGPEVATLGEAMAILSRATVTGVLVIDHFRCQGCGAETQEAIPGYPFGAFAPASPWIHRQSSRVHFCSPECQAAFYERQQKREREGHNERR
jgi:hypothetical protein